MRLIRTMIFSLTVILNSIELGLQSKRGYDDYQYPSVPHYEPNPSSPGRRSPDTTLSLAIRHSPSMSPPHAETSLRARSRSPEARQTIHQVLGFTLGELRDVRLIPHNNPDQIMEFRRYIFPRDKPIRLRARNQELLPMPTEERIVIATIHGDVYAIVDKLSSGNVIFRGIHKPVNLGSKRAKINMISGTVEVLTEEEIANCPAGQQSTVAKSFEIVRL